MSRFTTLIQQAGESRSRKVLLMSALVAVIALIIVGSVWAIAPPTSFGYITVCHKAGTPFQETLILRAKTANGHLAHGDPQAQCAAPLPETAAGVPIDPAKGYHVEQIGDGQGVYWITEGTYHVMFVTTGEGVIVVDAPPSIGPNILNAIAEVTEEPITHVIYSHSHADHIAAAGLYPPDATYIAHEETLAQLERERPYPFGAFLGGGPVPLPDVTFSDNLTLEVGNQTLELVYPGVNHDRGNIFIYAPAQRVLMFIDVVFPGWIPFTELAVAEDVPGFYQVHDDILSYDFDVLVSGHLGRLATRDDVLTQQEYILDVQNNAAEALMNVDFFAIAGDVGFDNSWLLFDTYLDAVAQRCADSTLDKWLGRLGGADIWTFAHCATVVESLRID